MGSLVLLLSVWDVCGPFGIWQPSGEGTDGKIHNLSDYQHQKSEAGELLLK